MYRPPARRNQRRAYKNVYHSKYRWKNYTRGLGQLTSDVIKLKNLINVEFKNHEYEISADVVDTNGDVYPLNYVNQGDGSETRDGGQFRMKSLEARYQISLDSNQTDPCTCRVIIFLDVDPTGSTPTKSDLLDATGSAPLAPRNLDNRHQFVILSDELFTLNPNGMESKAFKFYKRLDNKVLFTGATATAANNKHNGLYVLTVSDVTPAATYKPICTGSFRIRFVDN